MSYCLAASCLAHRERVFWHPWLGAWVHTSCSPCEALAGEPDPTELRCAHCGQRTDVDGAGRLWTYHPEGGEHWRAECAASPEGLHSVLCASQAPQ